MGRREEVSGFEFAPAVKQARKLRLAIDGPSGSGKTYTALTLATALADKVAVIDTERHSASLYADLFTFDALALVTFEPDTLVKALAAAGANGYEVVVVDSLSHFWSGTGGMLEQADNAGRRSGGNSFAGWKEARPMERRMVEALLAYPGHVIVTMRTKTEWVIEEQQNRNGRTVSVPKRLGMKPEQREGIEYEFDVVGDMDLEHNLVITKTRAVMLAGKVYNNPDAELAKTLRDWLGDGKAVPTVSEYVDRAVDADATRESLLALLTEVRAAGLAGAAVLDDTGETTTLELLISTRGRALAQAEKAAEAGAA